MVNLQAMLGKLDLKRRYFGQRNGLLTTAVVVDENEPLVRAGGYGITSSGPTRFSGNDVGPPEQMD